jgi:hypothetical protein
MENISRGMLLPCTLVLLLCANPSFAQQLKFSGTYVLAGASGDLRFDPKMKDQPILKIGQTTDDLQTTLIEKGGTEIITLPLNGSEAAYTTLDGDAGRARIETKNKQIRIRRVVQLKSYPNLSPSAIYVVETWTLSKDGKTLKICGDAEVRGGIAQFKKSGCQIFKRR